MLKQRLLTALVLIPLVVWLLFVLDPFGLALFFGAIIAAAAWEWAGLSGWSAPVVRAAYTLLIVAAGAALIAFSPVLPVLAAGVLWWLWSVYELAHDADVHHGMLGTRAGKAIGGALILIPAWFGAVHLRAEDAHAPFVLLYLLSLVWVADSAAYFAGHRFGRRKLAPSVSPGKTLEGVFGAVAAVIVLALVAGLSVWHLRAAALMIWVLIAVVTALFSVVGDLVESKAKRSAGVKDSGQLLPGHGGVCDRIDALTAAIPVFALSVLPLLRVPA